MYLYIHIYNIVLTHSLQTRYNWPLPYLNKRSTLIYINARDNC